MRIGVMLRNLKELGGIQVYSINLLENLLKIDQKNEYVFFYKDKSPLGRYARYPNVKERVVNFPTKLLWDQWAIPWAAAREGVDLIFNPKLSIPLFTRAKTLLVLHGLEQFAVREIFPRLDRLYFTLMMPLFCRKASGVITMTQMGVQDMKKYLGVNSGKVHAIHESHHSRFRFLPKEGLEEVRKKHKLPEKFLLFVGGLNPNKNFGNLLKAFKTLRAQIPHKLVAVGFKRWKFEKDLELVSELGLEKDVIFTGFVPDEDLPAIYNLADLFVFPSLYEGFGIPVLEAMACGCPVVTTKTGCSPEVAGGAAILVDPKNPAEIAQGIERVLTDQGLRRGLIEKGFNRAGQFSWEKTARQTLALMESLCS